MPDEGGYLPPVEIRITGDSADLIRALQEAKAQLASFARDAATAKLSADATRLDSDLAAARANIAEFTRKDYTIRVSADTTEALAQAAKLVAEIDAMNADVNVHSSGGRGLAGGALGALFGTGARSVLSGALWSGTGAGGGFLSRLLSPLTMLSTMFSAGFGSAGSFAGFGPEHLAMTAGGLAGLGVEGAAGAGLLGLGSAGVSGAGMLADSAGMKQAAGDARTYQAQLNNLNQAIAVYGRNSKQAQLAQYQMNQAMAGIAPTTVKAIAALAATGREFHRLYDKYTSPAEAVGAAILSQATKVGEAFLPELGKAATKNMGIIRTAVQPLFSWMKSQSGGLGIFTNLENIFSARLPTAMKAFDNGVEVLLKTINHIAPQTGGLTKFLAKLFTQMNTPTGFAKWSKEVDKLIGDFRLLEQFGKALGHDLHSLFKDDAGEPQAIVSGLTAALQKLGRWMDSAKGKASLMSVFATHKQEILELGRAIGQFATSFGKVYMVVAPAFVGAVNTMLRAILPLITAMARNPVGAWVLALGVIGAKLGVFKSLLAPIGSALGQLALKGVQAFGKLVASGAVWIARQIAATVVYVAQNAVRIASATAAFIAENAATLGIVAGIAALIAAIVFLATHWRQTWNVIKTVATAVWHFLDGIWHDIVSATGTAVKAVGRFFSNLWSTVTGFASRIFHDVVNFFAQMWAAEVTSTVTGVAAVGRFFSRMWSDVTGFVKRIWTDVVNFFKRMWTDVHNGVTTGVSDVLTWIGSLPGKIKGFFDHAIDWLVDAGKAILQGLYNGLTTAWKDVTGFFSGIGSWISKHKGPIEVDRVLLVPHGRAIMAGLYQGLSEGYGDVKTLVSGMGAGISGGLSVSVSGGSQQSRIEGLLTQILAAAKDSGVSAKQTARNTEGAVPAIRGLSSPAGVQAQIRQGNGQLVRNLRAGIA